jgi:hypothetical protein
VKHLIFTLLCALLATGCKRPKGGSASTPKPWYATYFEHPLSADQTFHSELQLAAGQKAELKIHSNEPVIIGFTLEKGYEVFQSKGSVWLGPPEKPHKTGGAPGVSDKFVPKEGVVTLIVENESPVDTRLAIYTEPIGKD